MLFPVEILHVIKNQTLKNQSVRKETQSLAGLHSKVIFVFFLLSIRATLAFLGSPDQTIDRVSLSTIVKVRTCYL